MTLPKIHGTVFKNGSATLLARVVGEGGKLVTQASLIAAAYTVYMLDDDAPVASIRLVAGHENVSVAVPGLIHDTLQTDDLWDVDTIGYNFRHTLDVSANQAFAKAGRTHRIVFSLTPTSGQVILVRFRLDVV